MSSEFKAVAANGLPKGLPEDAVQFSAMNGTLITTTTKQTIKAGTAGKRLFITQANAVNNTTGEDAVSALRHGSTDVALLLPVDAGAQINAAAAASVPGQNAGQYTYDPPIIIPAGVDLDGIGVVAALGDVTISVNGYIGT